jgi:hypothetical protein
MRPSCDGLKPWAICRTQTSRRVTSAIAASGLPPKGYNEHRRGDESLLVGVRLNEDCKR